MYSILKYVLSVKGHGFLKGTKSAATGPSFDMPERLPERLPHRLPERLPERLSVFNFVCFGTCGLE